jgi:hypothetical protein
MAATIITIYDTEAPAISIQIKVNDGHTVPSDIIVDSIQSFRTWNVDQDHLFVWIDDSGYEKAMVVPREYIGYVLSSMPSGIERDRFRIDNPCSVTVEQQ